MEWAFGQWDECWASFYEQQILATPHAACLWNILLKMQSVSIQIKEGITKC